jgi:hypothetical protein
MNNGNLNVIATNLGRSEREADHSPPSSAEVKNGAVMSTFPYVFMA